MSKAAGGMGFKVDSGVAPEDCESPEHEPLEVVYMNPYKVHAIATGVNLEKDPAAAAGTSSGRRSHARTYASSNRGS